MDEYGVMKVYVAVNIPPRNLEDKAARAKLVQVFQAFGSRLECKQMLARLLQMNKSMPVVKAEWIMTDDLMENK